jgi:hypothetical protein
MTSKAELNSLKLRAEELRKRLAFIYGIPEKDLHALCDTYRIIGKLER